MKLNKKLSTLIAFFMVNCILAQTVLTVCAESSVTTSMFSLESGTTAYGGVVLTDTENGVYVDNTRDAVENGNLSCHAPTSKNPIDITKNNLHFKLANITGRGLLGSDDSTYGAGYWESRYTLMITIGNKTHSYYSSLNYADDSIVIALSQTFPDAKGLYKVWWNKTSSNNFVDNPTPGNAHIISSGTVENAKLPLYNYGNLDVTVQLIGGYYHILLNGLEIVFEDDGYFNPENMFVSFQMAAPMNSSYLSKYPKTEADGGGDAWNGTLNYTPRGSHFVINQFEVLERKDPSILLNQRSISLCVGEKQTLNAALYPDDATVVSWSSDNEGIATVDNGVVTAVAPGIANVVVTGSNGKSDTCVVNVISSDAKSALNTSYLSLENGNGASVVDTATGVKINNPSNVYTAYVTTKHRYAFDSGVHYKISGITRNNDTDAGDYSLAFAIGRNTNGQQWFDKQGYMLFYGKSGNLTIVRTKGRLLYQSAADVTNDGYDLILTDKIDAIEDDVSLYIKEEGSDWKIVINNKHVYTIQSAANKFGGAGKDYWISVGTMSDFEITSNNPLNKLNYWGSTTDNAKCGLSFTVTNISPVLSTLFSDNMMFQQNKPINVWGYADVNQPVTVKLYCQNKLIETKSSNAETTGKWSVEFSALTGGYEVYSLEISLGSYLEYQINNILIGELWVAGGQSNMEWELKNDKNASMIMSNGNNNIRAYLEPTYPFTSAAMPCSKAINVPNAFWTSGDDMDKMGNVSSVAYTFAAKLQDELDVPIGIINTAVGGTVIESWLSRESVEDDAQLYSYLTAQNPTSYYLNDTQKYYEEKDWQTKSGASAFALFNSKIAPLANMNIAGVIWYQGESNIYSSEIYDEELVALKKCWSENFGFENSSDLPFIFTQFAPYDSGIPGSGNSALIYGYISEACERAYKTLNDGNTAMITLYDLPLDYAWEGKIPDDMTERVSSIHPRIKTPVGQRFAKSAINLIYGGNDESTAPIYKSMLIKNGAIYITFSNVGKQGLTTVDLSNNVHGFTIAGSDNVYVNAKAKIVTSDTVKIWNEHVKDPKNVMYAFDDMSQGSSLCNSAGIPASPFRTYPYTDNVFNPDKNTIFFIAQDWMFADKDPWVCTDPYEAKMQYDFQPAFSLSGNATVYSYDNAVFSEGTASVKVDYTGDFSISPILSYPSVKWLNWKNYNNISVKVRNTKDIKLSMTINGYEVPSTNSCELLSSDDFVTVTFDFTKLEESVKNSLGNSPTIIFNVSAAEGGTVNFDNFMLGMSKEKIYCDINNDSKVDILDMIRLKKIIANVTSVGAEYADLDDDPVLSIDSKDLVILREYLLKI